MNWRRTGDKPLYEAMMPLFADAYICVTRPQSVNLKIIIPVYHHINLNEYLHGKNCYSLSFSLT